MPYGKRFLHGSARHDAPHLRAEFQASKERAGRALAAPLRREREDGGAKWRKRTTTGDALMGPKKPKSTVLTAGRGGHRGGVPAEDAAAHWTMSWVCLRDAIPHLSRSALHRCLQRPRASPGCRSRRTKEQRKTVSRPTRSATSTSIAASCATPTANSSCFLAHRPGFSKFTYVEFHDSAGKMGGLGLPQQRRAGSSPYKIHTVLTDNGMAFADLPKNRGRPQPPLPGTPTSSNRVCMKNGNRAPVDQAPITLGPTAMARANETARSRTPQSRSFHYGRSAQPEGPCPWPSSPPTTSPST